MHDYPHHKLLLLVSGLNDLVLHTEEGSVLGMLKSYYSQAP
jgi:hypothetical protein